MRPLTAPITEARKLLGNVFSFGGSYREEIDISHVNRDALKALLPEGPPTGTGSTPASVSF